MSVTVKTKYLGELRTKSLHVKSQENLITDAPVDNNGKGEAFSPTDLLATSLATCMITIMGIAAKTHKLAIEGLECNVTKVMAANPRRVAEIIIEFRFPQNDFDDRERQILKNAARSCPVALSLHPDVKQSVDFVF